MSYKCVLLSMLCNVLYMQDMKCVGMLYLEAIRKLKDSGFEPTRTIYLSYVPDEEIGGRDGAEKLAASDVLETMNVAFVMDEGGPSADDKYQAYYAERSPMWLVIKATGEPGHGANLYDNTAMENLLKSIESIKRFRAAEFDMVKAGLKTRGDVISVNLVFLKAGTESPTVSLSLYRIHVIDYTVVLVHCSQTVLYKLNSLHHKFLFLSGDVFLPIRVLS